MAKSQGLDNGVKLKDGVYTIEKTLGSGSFGITYLATAIFETQGALGKMEVEAKVAIKEFFMSEVNSRKPGETNVEGSSGSVFTNYRKKFKKEAENLAKLSYPEIVKVFDIFNENNTTYYVMEFLDGTNLDDYIKLQGRLDEEEALAITEEIGKALEYMHSNKMLHLDIKPKNIMRKKNGDCVLIDFGLSKQFTAGGEPESSTSIGLGTPGYSPLEQATFKNTGKFPATLDVYALGATLFKMLTGEKPPEATYILNEGFPEQDFIRPSNQKQVSQQTISAVRKAMSPITKTRFKSIKEFLDTLTDKTEILDQEEHRKKEEEERKRKEEEERKRKEEEEARRRKEDEEKLRKEEENLKKDEEKRPSKRFWPYVVGAILSGGAIVWLVFAIKDSNQPESSRPVISQEIVEGVKEKIPTTVTDVYWNSPLGECIYSGQVMTPDITDPKNSIIPNGQGRAKILSGEYKGCVYEGAFSGGIMEGKATYILPNGDSFEGSFHNNQFYKGKYTDSATGDYFYGVFKDKKPYDGFWYDKNGKIIEDIRP